MDSSVWTEFHGRHRNLMFYRKEYCLLIFTTMWGIQGLVSRHCVGFCGKRWTKIEVVSCRGRQNNNSDVSVYWQPYACCWSAVVVVVYCKRDISYCSEKTGAAFQCGACQGRNSRVLPPQRSIHCIKRFLAIRGIILEQSIMGYCFTTSVFSSADLESPWSDWFCNKSDLQSCV